MDKETWQIILGMKVVCLLTGLISIIFLPPYGSSWESWGYVDIFKAGFVGIGSLLLIAGLANVIYNIWGKYKHNAPWESLYEPGPEHTLVAVYFILIPMIYTTSVWFLFIGYILSISLVVFIIGAHLGAELKHKKGQN